MGKSSEQYKILIVDDTVENIQILSEILHDYKKIIATSGKIALELANVDPKPDLILLDIMMPEMDGYEVCERLKKNNETKDIPIIFVTANSLIEDEIRGLELGAVDFITKPVSPPKVIARVKTQLAMSDYRKQLENMNDVLAVKVRERTSELEIAKDKAEESNRIKSHFLAMMSHELRTPMVGILGFSEMLKSELKDEKLKGFAVNLHKAGNRLEDTLNAILNLSRLESNKKFIDTKFFDPIERIVELLEAHKMNAELKGLKLSFISEHESLKFNSDLVKFDIIINNLIGNAIKYTNEGEVIVGAISSGDKDLQVLEISITDTGIGIADDKHNIVFEEFRQVDEGFIRNFEGVGLGLSLVKKYVQNLSGSIQLESKLGEGSKFTVTIPSFKTLDDLVAETVKAKKTVNATIPNDKIQLLIVEDDETNYLVHQLFLEDFCEITIAKTGNEALIFSKTKKFDSILMDINLGRGPSGIEITKLIRKMELNSETPIIAFTAFALDGDRTIFIDAGCTDYLTKPTTKDELRNVVLKYVK